MAREGGRESYERVVIISFIYITDGRSTWLGEVPSSIGAPPGVSHEDLRTRHMTILNSILKRGAALRAKTKVIGEDEY